MIGPYCHRCYLEASGLALALARGGMPALLLARARAARLKSAETAQKSESGSPRKTVESHGKNHANLTLRKRAATDSLADVTMAQREPDLRDLRPISQAADALGCSTRSIRNWIDAGILKEYWTPGRGKRLVDLNELRRKLEP